jgi:hypothetical protein
MSSATDQDRQDDSRGVARKVTSPWSRSGRRPYERPRLVVLGDVRDVTLGQSPGTGDSNDPGMLQF